MCDPTFNLPGEGSLSWKAQQRAISRLMCMQDRVSKARGTYLRLLFGRDGGELTADSSSTRDAYHAWMGERERLAKFLTYYNLDADAGQ